MTMQEVCAAIMMNRRGGKAGLDQLQPPTVHYLMIVRGRHGHGPAEMVGNAEVHVPIMSWRSGSLLRRKPDSPSSVRTWSDGNAQCSTPRVGETSGLGLGDCPSATTELIGELFGRERFHHLILRGLPPSRGRDGSTLASFCVRQLIDDRCRFVACELAAGLTLGEAHGTAGVAKVDVSGLFEEGQQLPHLG
jgi:hypothetical protein